MTTTYCESCGCNAAGPCVCAKDCRAHTRPAVRRPNEWRHAFIPAPGTIVGAACATCGQPRSKHPRTAATS